MLKRNVGCLGLKLYNLYSFIFIWSTVEGSTSISSNSHI